MQTKELSNVQKPKLAHAWDIGRASLSVVWGNKKLFSIILLFYALAYIIGISALGSGTSTSSIVEHYKSINQGSFSGLWSGISTYTYLVGSLAGNNSPISGAYQMVLFVSMSLVIIYSINAINKGQKITVRDSFYKSSTPFIQFFLILMLIGIEFLPLVIAVALYNIVISGGIAVLAFEKIIWAAVLVLFSILTFYLVTTSIMALYIVALSDTRPMAALKQAKALVKGRRLVVFVKLAFLPITLGIVIGIIMLPLILIIPAAAQLILFILSLIALVISHSYMFNLNSELSK